MILLDASIATPATFWDWFKIIAPLLTGGVVGALITALITDRRNRIQPVSTRLRISAVDIPTIMPGYDSAITLASTADGAQYHYKKLSTVQLEIINTGNKDLDYLDFGIGLPTTSEIIGVQHHGQDRYHVVTHTPEISITQTSSIIDFKLTPFHRKDAYLVTLVVSGTEPDLQGKIQLSKRQPIKFVDADLLDRRMAITASNLSASYVGNLMPWPTQDILRKVLAAFLANR